MTPLSRKMSVIDRGYNVIDRKMSVIRVISIRYLVTSLLPFATACVLMHSWVSLINVS